MTTVIEEKTTADAISGEVTKEIVSVNKFRSEEPDYVKLYIKAWCEFKEIKGINTAFLYQLLPSMTYAQHGQIIYTNSAMKKNIAKCLKWSEKTACQRASLEIRKLCDAGILRKIQNGEYQVNPELIGKGEWKHIKLLRATFNLETGEVTHFYEQSEEE